MVLSGLAAYVAVLASSRGTEPGPRERGNGEYGIQPGSGRDRHLEKADKLYHALKSAETYHAMKDAGEMDEEMSGRMGRSYARRRDSMGRYTSRGMGQYGSGRYPMEPMSYGYYPDEWRY